VKAKQERGLIELRIQALWVKANKWWIIRMEKMKYISIDGKEMTWKRTISTGDRCQSLVKYLRLSNAFKYWLQQKSCRLWISRLRRWNAF
jgi:hypothetical protein